MKSNPQTQALYGHPITFARAGEVQVNGLLGVSGGVDQLAQFV